MNYFNYFPDIENQGKIWGLFESLQDFSEVDYHTDRSVGRYTLEIMSAARSGRISLDGKFDLAAYERTCSSNTEIGKLNKAKKELHIVSFDDTEEDKKPGYGDVSDRRLGKRDVEYEIVDNMVGLGNSIQKLFELRRKYRIENGIDIVSLVVSASEGVYEAVRNLKILMGTNSEISALVYGLFESGIPLSKIARRLRSEVEL